MSLDNTNKLKFCKNVICSLNSHLIHYNDGDNNFFNSENNNDNNNGNNYNNNNSNNNNNNL